MVNQTTQATLGGLVVGDRVRVLVAKYDRWPIGTVGTVISLRPAGMKRGFWDGYQDGKPTGGVFERYEPDKIGVRFDERVAQWSYLPSEVEKLTD